MKDILYPVNIVFLLIVIGFYSFEPVYGALLQIPLGIIQVVFALLLLKGRKELTHKNNKLLSIYFYSLLGWVISFVAIIYLIESDNIYYFFLFIIPMILATFFVIITYLIQKNHEIL